MSVNITTAFVKQYDNNYMLLYQQGGSKLRGHVRTKTVSGESDFFDRIGATDVVEKTTRHQDTPQIDTPHSRRRVDMRDFWWADLVDKEDEVRLLKSPASSYAQNAAFAMGRKEDDLIIAAFNGAAKTGQAGDTSVAFPAAQQIANGGTGMTIAKLRQAKRILDTADVPASDRFIVVSPIALNDDLLATTEVSSADYNVVKALVQGDIDTFLGFKFIMSTRLTVAANIRSCFAWHKRAMGRAIGRERVTRISERDDKGYAVQVFVQMSFEAVRIEDEGVVQIDIDESA